jgi:predicted transport protein
VPLFAIQNKKLSTVAQGNFQFEKELQQLIEANLETAFSCRFVASEFSTGAQHAGRIDTLALSEDNNPVIIEYKKVESSELINQSLYYLAWIYDHRGDFELMVKKKLGQEAEVDWSDVRVICLAPSFKKFDLYAAQMMPTNIELWTYRLYQNDCFYFEQVLQPSYAGPGGESEPQKNPVMVAAGKKAAITKATGTYDFEEHLDYAGSAELKELATAIQDFILKLDPKIEEAPKKNYVAYRTSQNIVCMEIMKQKIVLFLKLNPKLVTGPPGISRDVSELGHYGTGDLEITIHSAADFELAKPFIVQAYQAVGA